VIPFNEAGDAESEHLVWSFKTREPDSDYDMTEIPAITQLIGNFPNPFNPYTTIQFSVAAELASAHVRLEIFNIRGQRVRTLVNDIKLPGHHSVVWDGRDDHGRSVGSGVYFYRLQAGDFSQTKRMLLLK
jgi:hypothetical protein